MTQVAIVTVHASRQHMWTWRAFKLGWLVVALTLPWLSWPAGAFLAFVLMLASVSGWLAGLIEPGMEEEGSPDRLLKNDTRLRLDPTVYDATDWPY